MTAQLSQRGSAARPKGERRQHLHLGAHEKDGWSKPIVVSAAAEIAHWNPVLFQKEDGTVILYFKVGKDTDYWQTYYATSTDGRSWSTPRELVPGDNSGGRGPVKNKPIRLKTALFLHPLRLRSTASGEHSLTFPPTTARLGQRPLMSIPNTAHGSRFR